MQHRASDLELQPLSKRKLAEHLRRLEAIDADTLGELWGEAQWLLDLPGKWELSRMLLRGAQPVGFLIASRKKSALHIHRLAVAADERGQGLGGMLMASAAEAALEQGCPDITLKVHRTNAGAIAFYTRLGFTTSGSSSGNDSLEMTGDSRRTSDLTESLRLPTARRRVEE